MKRLSLPPSQTTEVAAGHLLFCSSNLARAYAVTSNSRSKGRERRFMGHAIGSRWIERRQANSELAPM
jgi:hypothetical protein